MSGLAALDHRLDAAAATCRAVIETPRHSRTKYVYCEDLCAFQLKKLLPEGMVFPLDFGFVPSTLAGDGDPLDILVLHDEPIAMGAVVDVRLIGVIEACQTKDAAMTRNDRVVAVAASSQLYRAFANLGELGGDFLEHLKEFFVNYNALQGRTFEVLRVGGPAEAVSAIVRDSVGP